MENEHLSKLYEELRELRDDLSRKERVVASCRRDGWSDSEISPSLFASIEGIKESIKIREDLVSIHSRQSM